MEPWDNMILVRCNISWNLQPWDIVVLMNFFFNLKLQWWSWWEDQDLMRETSLLMDNLSVMMDTMCTTLLWFAGLLKHVVFLFALKLHPKITQANLPRSLGYSSGQATSNSQFGSVSRTFAMDNVRCTGNEASLQECPHLTEDNCGSHEGAGVICSYGRLQAFWANFGMCGLLPRLPLGCS